MDRLRVLAFAKVNLFLGVGPRQADGYHEVDTVLQSIALADRIEAAQRPDGAIRLEAAGDFAVPPDRRNLCWRAAQQAQQAWAPGQGLEIRLSKRVPVGAGLGGGSSDAAAVLAAACALWQVQPSAYDQVAVAARLGSDVPFFVVGGTAAASGRGERIEPLPPAPPRWLVLGKPATSVSTTWAYQRFDTVPPREPADSRPMRAALARGDLEAVAAALHNDLEAAVLPAVSDAARLKDDLLARGCLGALMAGSGSAVFGIASDEESARRIAHDLAARYPLVRAACTCPQANRILPPGAPWEEADA